MIMVGLEENSSVGTESPDIVSLGSGSGDDGSFISGHTSDGVVDWGHESCVTQSVDCTLECDFIVKGLSQKVSWFGVS